MGKVVIVTISGTTCAGKTTLARGIIANHDSCNMIQSVTTRESRPTDLLGEYAYVSREDFDRLEEQGRFIWSVDYGSAAYGTLFSSIVELAKKESGVGIMILTPNVMSRLREFLGNYFPAVEHVPIFLRSPSKEIVLARASARGDDVNKTLSRLEEGAKWDIEANGSAVPFQFIDNFGMPEEMVRRVLCLLG